MVEVHKKLTEAAIAYRKSVGAVIDDIEQWKENDPVVSIYSNVFNDDAIIKIDTKTNKKELLAEWRWRLINKIPPGYKDAAKDVPLGDFLIWRAILEAGRKTKKDCIFITGEEKADWFVRSGRGVFARPELISEYGRFSGGKSFMLMSLAGV